MSEQKKKRYTVYFNRSERSFYGTDPIDGIKNNMYEIGQTMCLGNVAGFDIDAASLKYDPSLFSGEGGGVLEVTAHGADSYIGYDAINDKPVTKTATIKGVKAEDLPEIHIFEISETKRHFDPLHDDLSNMGYSGKYGIIWAILSYVAKERCYKKEPYIEGKLYMKGDRMLTYQPYKYTEKMREMVMRAGPKPDAYTKQLMDRADELLATIDPKQDMREGYDYPMKEALTRIFLERYGKVSALKYYREKMGATGQQIADATGISLRQYWRYENGEASLHDAAHHVVQALAKALNVNEGNIMERGFLRYVNKK